MNALDLIAQARAAGLTLQLNGDGVTVRGPRTVALPLLDTLREHKPEILAVLHHEQQEITWRVEVLVARIPRTGPIWPVVVRPGDTRLDTPSHCSLCGDELSIERLTSPWRRCAPCVAALHEALRLIREGVPAAPAVEHHPEAPTSGGRRVA